MKYNLERELEMIQEHVKEVKDKISELNRRYTALEQANYADIGLGYGQAPQQMNNQHSSQQLTYA